ncbi:hypothetical protein MHU86_25677 [Fragilaria crotonensis]|nr:hypothetical protein MHU86_25677 [Fragilaria crotonensis]
MRKTRRQVSVAVAWMVLLRLGTVTSLSVARQSTQAIRQPPRLSSSSLSSLVASVNDEDRHSTRGTMKQKKTVAVIGGGIAGLSCANALVSSGCFIPTVFDTGRLRPGGRCASRLPDDRPKDDDNKDFRILGSTIIDHAAQILTVLPGYSEFRTQVEEWERRGIVKKFEAGSVCSIGNPVNPKTKQHDKTKIRIQPIKGDMYYGVNGMQSIPMAMMRGIDVKQDVWVSPSNGVRLVNGQGGEKWEVKAKGQVVGQFDRLVIAHNGKCADRLMSSTPAKDFHRLLQVNFAPFVPRDGGNKMTLNSLYSLSFAVPADSVLSKTLIANQFVCGFIKNHPNLRFISCNTRKHATTTDKKEGIEVWTVLSSAKFGKRYKGAQENLSDDLVKEVTDLLFQSLEESLVLPPGSLYRDPHSSCVLESRLQLWGAGVPLNTWIPREDDDMSRGFLYDSQYKVGACGDWLLDASLAGAWESGRRLAHFMASDSESSVGLEGRFQASTAVDKVGIGSLS